MAYPTPGNSLPRLPDLRLSTSPMGRGPRINYSEGHTLVRAAEAIATKFDLSMVGVFSNSRSSTASSDSPPAHPAQRRRAMSSKRSSINFVPVARASCRYASITSGSLSRSSQEAPPQAASPRTEKASTPTTALVIRFSRFTDFPRMRVGGPGPDNNAAA